MRILIVGIGALGGTIATRALSAGMTVHLATRTAETASTLRSLGLRVSGYGGEVGVQSFPVAALEAYRKSQPFDLILLATKAHEAFEIAGFLSGLLAPGGVLLPIQNGGIAQLLADRLGQKVLGGLSNLGASMISPGVYEQRNPGHLLIGELAGGASERVERIASVLRTAVDIKASVNLRGAIWAKLLINCAITTVGAVAAHTMREYMQWPSGREVFRRAYTEALSVALATGAQPQKITAEPIPPGWPTTVDAHDYYGAWVDEWIDFYGDIKPSMLQDFERGRKTEIDFINGYVTQLGVEHRIPVPMNAAITELVRRIESGKTRPAPERLNELLLSRP